MHRPLVRLVTIVPAVAALLWAAPALAQDRASLTWPGASGATGKSDPAFSQPSLPTGVDYTLPAEAEIKAVLDRVREHFERSTPYRVIDTATGAPIADLSKPVRTAGIDNRAGEFNDWTYSMGVVLAAMLQAAEVTGDARYQQYALKDFDFIFDHLDYFRRQPAPLQLLTRPPEGGSRDPTVVSDAMEAEDHPLVVRLRCVDPR